MLTNKDAKVVAAAVVANVIKPMAKARHIIYANGKISHRAQYNPSKHGRYSADKHFMEHERSPFLEHVLGNRGERYVQWTAKGTGSEQMKNAVAWITNAAKGLESKYWKFLYGSWTDKGSLISIRSHSPIRSLDDLGIHVVDPVKAPKYIKRVFAPHEHAVFGKILEIHDVDDGQIIKFELDNGYVGYHRNVELEKMPSDLHRACVDGIALALPEFLTMVGVKSRDINTYGGKGTVFNPFGLGKGYLHARPGLQWDLVTYGAKKSVVFDDFFFGIMGSLKPGEEFKSDIQSLGNFDEHIVAVEAAKDFMSQISESLDDKDKLRGLFMSFLKNVSKDENEESATEGWLLINALQAGMDAQAEPGLFRRVYNFFMDTVLSCEEGRVPFAKYGMRCDAMPEVMHIIDDLGDVYPERSIIPPGCICSWDVPVGPVVTSRSPNGHAEERNDVFNVHIPEFKKYQGLKRNFVGPLSGSSHNLIEYLANENGMDFDDTERTIFDPALVKHIRMQTYPTTEKMVVTEPKRTRPGRFYDVITRSIQNLSTASYTVQDFIFACERALKMKVQLGQVVLAIQLDTLLSGKHKANMMKDLTRRIQGTSDEAEAIFLLNIREWLAEREDYQLAYVATNLEAFIDFCVQGKGDPKLFQPWVKLIMEIKTGSQVYPYIFAKEGTGFDGKGRIDPRTTLGVDYVLAPSLLCESMAEVEQLRKEFVNDLKLAEWTCITPIPAALEQEFGSSPDITQIAKEIRKFFNPASVAAMSNPEAEQRNPAYNAVLYGRFHVCRVDGPVQDRCLVNCPDKGKLLEEGLEQMFEALDPEVRLFVAVELKRLVHSKTTPQYNEDGTVRSVSDGVFSNNVVFNYYLEALEKAGLTGKYVPVYLDLVSLGKGIKSQIFEVTVLNGNILRKRDDFWVGVCDANDGEYRIVNGLLEVRKPHVSITAEANYANMNEDGEGGDVSDEGTFYS